MPEIEPIIISRPKLHQDLLNLPLSATVAGRDFLDSAAIRTVKDAAIHAPNTIFTEFSARKLSNPRFRKERSACHPVSNMMPDIWRRSKN